MRKFITTAIPIVTEILFIIIMLSGGFLKHSLGKDDNVPKLINEIIDDVNQDAWDQVNEKTDDLQKAWEKVIFRIQFSSERDEINFLSTNIARLRGAAIAKDKAIALSELKDAYNHWSEIGK